MARIKMQANDVKRNWTDALTHVIRGDEVEVTRYGRTVALIIPPPPEEEPMDTTTPKKQRYTTRQDAIEQDILPALTEGEYDVEAICREAYEYRVDTNERGQELLNTAGFEQVVSDEEFWEIVARHDKSGEQ